MEIIERCIKKSKLIQDKEITITHRLHEFYDKYRVTFSKNDIYSFIDFPRKYLISYTEDDIINELNKGFDLFQEQYKIMNTEGYRLLNKLSR